MQNRVLHSWHDSAVSCDEGLDLDRAGCNVSFIDAANLVLVRSMWVHLELSWAAAGCTVHLHSGIYVCVQYSGICVYSGTRHADMLTCCAISPDAEWRLGWIHDSGAAQPEDHGPG